MNFLQNGIKVKSRVAYYISANDERQYSVLTILAHHKAIWCGEEIVEYTVSDGITKFEIFEDTIF